MQCILLLFVYNDAVSSCFYFLLKYPLKLNINFYFHCFYCFLLKYFLTFRTDAIYFSLIERFEVVKKIASFLYANFHSTVYHIIAKIQRHKSGCQGQYQSSYMDIYLTTLNPNADNYISLKWDKVVHLNDGKGVSLKLAVLHNISGPGFLLMRVIYFFLISIQLIINI